MNGYGFGDVGEDTDLLLKCCAAIISGDAGPKTIINLSGADVRNRFAEVRTGILGAIDFLRTHLKAYSTRVLPMPNVIVPLSVFFATDKDQNTHPDSEQQKIIIEWLWRTFFTRRYSKRLEQLNTDIGEVENLKNGTGSKLGQFSCNVKRDFFTDTAFNVGATNTKTHILMLATATPLDFISAGEIALGTVLRDCNRKEFHHIFPRALLDAQGINPKLTNCLVNFCILPRASNNKISAKPPSEYRTPMPTEDATVAEILSQALCPTDLFDDDFSRFFDARCDILVSHAKSLMGIDA